MAEADNKKVDVFFEDIENQVEVFQHFDEKSYSGKFLGYIKKIRRGLIGFMGLLLLIIGIDIVSIIFGSDEVSWGDVEVTFMVMIIVSLLGYVLIFVLQGFSLLIKNNEDQILERVNRDKKE